MLIQQLLTQQLVQDQTNSYEPCLVYRADRFEGHEFCAHCGWLEMDHIDEIRTVSEILMERRAS